MNIFSQPEKCFTYSEPDPMDGRRRGQFVSDGPDEAETTFSRAADDSDGFRQPDRAQSERNSDAEVPQWMRPPVVHTLLSDFCSLPFAYAVEGPTLYDGARRNADRPPRRPRDPLG